MGMGNNAKYNQTESTEPRVLEGTDIPSLAKYITSKGCKNIILMWLWCLTGLSTSAGIPDFRSPKTARLNLPHPEAVFEINFFRRNPVPFYTLAHELYPGKFRPTIAHSFIRLLENHSLLHTCFTQNIDTLERRAGVSDAKIIEAHGSFATQRCIDCLTPFDDEQMKEHILQKKIARCGSCLGLVKPDIVFFGESLPPRFIKAIPSMSDADLLIIMGTSLTVHPFASLAEMPDSSCPRVLINLDKVGGIGRRRNDVVLLGKCDDIVRELCKELGWEEELLQLWAETEDSVVTEETKTSKRKSSERVPGEHQQKTAEEEVESLTSAIEQSLALNDDAPAIGEKAPKSVPQTSGPAATSAPQDVSTKPKIEESTTIPSSATEKASSDPPPSVDGKL
ncbi:Sir2 family histone deacetylase Hst2 [Crucibulum laeve]|uniref:Sir2 family histone deacetylase Hst2 n=1 Tax=Crucibulum laeve TaxID=68775 RepID=A0A5C3LNG5_9AGAR|nr:Sir2 family histone deacetylase Hst2 [Crucibulum laeve]